MKILVISIFIIIAIYGCRSYNCDDIPDCFPSTDSALKYLEKSSFRFKDEIRISDTSKSWIPHMYGYIESVKYYSCDKKKGYFIYTVADHGGVYFLKGVPLEIWNQFKQVSVKGDYFESTVLKNFQGITLCVEVNLK